MQNLVTQLLEPGPNMTGPTTLQRRAAEAIVNLTQLREQDQMWRVRFQESSDKHLAMANEYFKLYGPSNHEEAYREVMNEEYRLNCT